MSHQQGNHSQSCCNTCNHSVWAAAGAASIRGAYSQTHFTPKGLLHQQQQNSALRSGSGINAKGHVLSSLSHP